MPPDGDGTKNASAVAMGRLGGAKGGHARAAALSKNERTEIARKAATVRWAKKKNTKPPRLIDRERLIALCGEIQQKRAQLKALDDEIEQILDQLL